MTLHDNNELCVNLNIPVTLVAMVPGVGGASDPYPGDDR